MSSPKLEPIRASEWDARKARHLLNRAGFGLPHDRIDKLASMSPSDAVDYFVDYEKIPETLPAPNFLVAPISRNEARSKAVGMTDEERRKLYNEYQQQERFAVQQLKGWWLWRMHTTPRPLQEKLALFWHGHFATSAQKVKMSSMTYQLNDLFRQSASGNLKKLTIDVGQSPSMLRYLDNVQSNKEHPNENWARELMELFTMGKGTYTEDDIKNSARAFTGWSADERKFAYRENIHDTGEKVFLGKRGNFDGWDILDIIFEQPATGQFMSKKMWEYFAYEDAEPEVINAMAETLRSNQYEVKPFLKQMFLSKAFYSDKAIGSQIKSPAQAVVQLASDIGFDNPPYMAMAQATQRLGQDLFYPPNVKGWDGGRAWINANTLLIRYNLPSFMVSYKPREQEYAMQAYFGQAGLQSPTQGGDTMMAANKYPDMASMKDTKANNPAAESAPHWDPQTFYASLHFSTAGECVDKMAERLLSVPLTKDQRSTLIAALEVPGPEAPLDPKSAKQRNLFAALHLMTSTAEYQLC